MALDEDGYPYEEDVEQIKNWGFFTTYDEVVSFLEENYSSYGRFYEETDPEVFRIFHVNPEEERILRTSTGGWSGCEDIMYAMYHNFMFKAKHWLAEVRGGGSWWRFDKK